MINYLRLGPHGVIRVCKFAEQVKAMYLFLADLTIMITRNSQAYYIYNTYELADVVTEFPLVEG